MSPDPTAFMSPRRASRASESYRPWTVAEVEQLRELAKTTHIIDIAMAMGRSRRSVAKAMNRYGIRSAMPRYLPPDNPREIARRTKTGHPGESNPNYRDGRSPREHQRDRLVTAYLAVFEALGGACAVCGTTDPLVLEVDHVADDGGEHRRIAGRGIPYARELLRTVREEPGRLQLLCANDHRRKRRVEGGWADRL